jgi:glutathionylspermidine synthase
MHRKLIQERPDWKDTAQVYGFDFHTMHGERYWDERAYYSFTLKQIEDDIEGPTEEIHQMCLAVVERVLNSEEMLLKFGVPEKFWDFIRNSWLQKDPSLYSRLDLRYDGKSPAKLYENNADTPTSVFETGFWQWLWLEEVSLLGWVPQQADQFNSLQDKLVDRFRQLKATHKGLLHFGSCAASVEDRGTVQYLADCAQDAGIPSKILDIEAIGDDAGKFIDLEDDLISWMFKLYPWEFMFAEEFGDHLYTSGVKWLEPFSRTYSNLLTQIQVGLTWFLLHRVQFRSVPKGGTRA